jgi:hypothetical protein
MKLISVFTRKSGRIYFYRENVAAFIENLSQGRSLSNNQDGADGFLILKSGQTYTIPNEHKAGLLDDLERSSE